MESTARDDIDVSTPPTGTALREQIDAVHEATGQWIASHRDQFDPRSWDDKLEQRSRMKALGEAGICCSVAATYEEATLPSAVPDLLTDVASDPQYHELLGRNPDEFMSLGWPLVFATYCDELPPEARRLSRSALETDTAWTVEYKPFKLVGLWNMCRALGYEDHRLDVDALARTGLPASDLDPVALTHQNVYALTHYLLFYHNFGLDRAGFPDDPLPFDHTDLYTCLVLRYLVRENLDAVGELLIVGLLQGQMSSDLVRLALSRMATRVDECGHVPGPDRSRQADAVGAEFEYWDGITDAERAWLDDYHTNLVCWLLTGLLRCGRVSLVEDVGPSLETERQFEDALEAAAVLDTLADYQLQDAASDLIAVSESTAPAACPAPVAAATEYLERQGDSGEYVGYWADERRLCLRQGYSEAEFRRDLVEPASATCEEAIAAANAALAGE